MTQHTPGPWRVDGPDMFGDYNIQPHGEELAVAAVVNGELREMGSSAGQTEANARLIAAAPDLLAELKLCEEMLCEASLFVPRTGLSKARADHMDARISAVRAALAKAEGRS